MVAAYLSRDTMARDYLTFRTVNAKRKSAVEILQETKSLFVKSEAVLDAEQRLVKAPKCDVGNYIASEAPNRKDPTLAKVRRRVQPTHTRSCSDQLQTNLRRLLNGSSKENVAEIQNRAEDQDGDAWLGCRMDAISFFELGHSPETDIQYQSLPDLSASSRESLSCTIQRAVSDSKRSDLSGSVDDVDMSTGSDTSIDDSMESSGKSYGKPPSMPKSLQSMGGSFGKVEERLTTWSEPKHVQVSRSRSFGADEGGPPLRLPHQPSLPADLNEFFQHLGLSSEQYNELTAVDSRSCSPMFFSSRGSVDSADLSTSAARRAPRSTSPPAPSPVSVVQTNARVVKWLCKTYQWL